MYEALIVELEMDERSAVVVTVKVAVVAPGATVTVLGTWATAILDEVRLTTIPPVGAAADSVTVPVELDPEATVEGERVNPVKLGPPFDIMIRHMPRP